jgi:hypothetical protein
MERAIGLWSHNILGCRALEYGLSPREVLRVGLLALATLGLPTLFWFLGQAFGLLRENVHCL